MEPPNEDVCVAHRGCDFWHVTSSINISNSTARCGKDLEEGDESYHLFRGLYQQRASPALNKWNVCAYDRIIEAWETMSAYEGLWIIYILEGYFMTVLIIFVFVQNQHLQLTSLNWCGRWSYFFIKRQESSMLQKGRFHWNWFLFGYQYFILQKQLINNRG